FPESPPLHQLGDTTLSLGFLHSDALRWSWGGMKGRAGDLFYRALATQPLTRQLDVIGRLGFDGVYIDRRGYADRAQALERELQALLGATATLQSDDGNVVFYRIEPRAQKPERSA